MQQENEFPHLSPEVTEVRNSVAPLLNTFIVPPLGQDPVTVEKLLAEFRKAQEALHKSTIGELINHVDTDTLNQEIQKYDFKARVLYRSEASMPLTTGQLLRTYPSALFPDIAETRLATNLADSVTPANSDKSEPEQLDNSRLALNIIRNS